MLDSFWNDLKLWATKPYDEEGSVLDWVFFIGLMVAVTYLWTRVIKRILD